MQFAIALGGVLLRFCGSFVGQVLLSLGISFVSYTGIDFAITEAKARALASLSGNGALFLQMAGVFQIGTAINIIASAYIGRTILSGITNGKLTKMVTKS